MYSSPETRLLRRGVQRRCTQLECLATQSQSSEPQRVQPEQRCPHAAHRAGSARRKTSQCSRLSLPCVHCPMPDIDDLRRAHNQKQSSTWHWRIRCNMSLTTRDHQRCGPKEDTSGKDSLRLFGSGLPEQTMRQRQIARRDCLYAT